MRILHLSDLHVSEDYPSYDAAWAAPRQALGADAKFDVIVLSGDLTQRASAEEYRALRAFIERSLFPLIDTSADRARRVIAVPGNHDVDWGAEVFDQQSICKLAKAGPEKLRETLAEARQSPRTSELRLVESEYGHLEILRKKEALYPGRFKEVQAFFDGLYGPAPSPVEGELCTFDLTGTPARNWSAHVFPTLGAAFYGFNSCVNNDRYWCGASLDPQAVPDAAVHADRHARGLTRVAVWHHGLSPEGGAIDALTPADLGTLVSWGFQLGLHGHIHADKAEALQTLYQGRFVRLAVGTLGASRRFRPELVGRQVAAVRLYPNQVQVSVLHEGPSHDRSRREFASAPPKTFCFGLDPVLARRPAEARLHRRTWELDPTGMARVSVRIEDFDVFDGAVLALIVPPYCQVETRPSASTSSGDLEVQRRELPDGRVRCVVGGRSKHALLEWEYRSSAAFAIYRDDDVRRSQRRAEGPMAGELPSSWKPRVGPDEEAFFHTVRFLTERLVLAVELPSGSSHERCRAIVEQPVHDHGVEGWQPVLTEANHCRLQPSARGGVELVVDGPSLGYRYAIVVTLPLWPQKIVRSPGTAKLIRSVLELTRGEARRARPVIDSLNANLREALIDFLLLDGFAEQGELGPSTEWLTLLWDEEDGQLVTAFGEFAAHQWNESFDAGHGAAGNAFRFSRPACRSGRGTSLLSRTRRDRRPDYEWVLCVPILDESLAAIGIFSVGSPVARWPGSPGDRRLALLAESFCRQDDGGASAQKLDQLASVVSSKFWDCLSRLEGLDELWRNRARRVLQTLVSAASPPPFTVPP